MSQDVKDLKKSSFKPVKNSFDRAEVISRPSESFVREAFRRLFKNKGAVIGLFVIFTIIFMSFYGPTMSNYKTNDTDINERSNLPPRVPFLENFPWLGMDGTQEIYISVSNADGTKDRIVKRLNAYEFYPDGSQREQPIEEYFYFGTDVLGRDLWLRVWEGTQVSLFIGFVAAFVDLVIGLIWGGVSGYLGGRVDNVMQRFVEILVGIPNLIVIILFIIWLEPGLSSIILAMVITGWIGMARIVRGQVMKIKNYEFVLAARTLGASSGRIIRKHLLPNAVGSIIVTTMFTIPSAIFFEAFLSFIGLGIRPPFASLGSLANDARDYFMLAPYQMIIPSIIISLLLLSFNLFADGLRDALDPKMKE